MKPIKEFFEWQIFINSLIFSLLVSLLVLLRAAYIGDIIFFSGDGFKVYITLTLIFSFIYLLFFFILFLLARRKPEED